MACGPFRTVPCRSILTKFRCAAATAPRSSSRPHPALATDTVRFVGEGVALVVAETRAAAEDAAEGVTVEYAALSAVAEARDALAADAPLVWNDHGTNVCVDSHAGDKAATDAAFRARRTSSARDLDPPRDRRADGAAHGDRRLRRGDRTLYALCRHRGGVVARGGPGRRAERARDGVPRGCGDMGGNFGTRNFFFPEYGCCPGRRGASDARSSGTATARKCSVSDYQGRDLTS